MKYQFCIRFHNIDANSAASKAVLDCNKIFSDHGYNDYTFTVGDNSNRLTYYFFLLRELVIFFFSIKRRSLVGIQYPLLSINNVFKFFIKISKIKGVKFFCIIHDLESLRTGGKVREQIDNEVVNLNCYDTVIVHNTFMLDWLKNAGVTKPMISIGLFDYLTEDLNDSNSITSGSIVYAGNLAKSTFIYALPQIKGKRFNVYGPGFNTDKAIASSNLTWGGQYSPDEVPHKLTGSFGLIWDGVSINECDEILGNYLKYNNPHKCSLYIAAGLPVIAPKMSAIGALIRELNLGILIDNLTDLETINIDEGSYSVFKENISTIRKKVINGSYFGDALQLIETELCK